MKPVVSVLIPSYNHAAFVTACLDSLLAQTFQNWEAVVVDDLSTDNSLELLATYESEKIRIVQNESNLGTYGTLQRALQLSTGPLVSILNSDDVWAPEKLEHQVSALNDAPEATFCYTLGRKIDMTGSLGVPGEVHGDWPTAQVQELLPCLLEENRILASSVIFRRESVSFDPTLRYSGDWVALLNASLAGQAVCVSEPLTYWRMHSNNSFRRSQAQVAEEVRVRTSILAALERWKVRAIADRDVVAGLAKCALHLSALLVLQGRVSEARSTAVLASKLSRTRATIKRLLAVTLPQPLAHRLLWADEAKQEPGEKAPLISFRSASTQG